MLTLIILVYIADIIKGITALFFIIGIILTVLGAIFYGGHYDDESKRKIPGMIFKYGSILLLISIFIPSKDFMKLTIAAVALKEISSIEVVRDTANAIGKNIVSGSGKLGNISSKAIDVLDNYLDGVIAEQLKTETKEVKK